MRRFDVLLVAFICCSLLLTFNFGCAPEAEKETFTMNWICSPPSAGNAQSSVVYSKLLEKYSDKVRLNLMPGHTSAECALSIINGEADAGLMAATQAYPAYLGRGEWGKKFPDGMKDIRHLNIFNTSGSHFVVAAESDIKTIYDLKGKSIGTMGEATANGIC